MKNALTPKASSHLHLFKKEFRNRLLRALCGVRLSPVYGDAARDLDMRSAAHCLTSDLTQATVRGPSWTGEGKLFARSNP